MFEITLPKKVMEKDYWITTEQVVKELMNAPDNEQEYTRCLGGILRSTHWFIFDSKRGLFGDSINIEFDWFTKNEFLEAYSGALWHRDY